MPPVAGRGLERGAEGDGRRGVGAFPQTPLGSGRGICSESPETRRRQAPERGGWTLTSASSPPAGGVLWNVRRSWPGSGRPTSTPSTSSWDPGSMRRGPARRPPTWLLKVGVPGAMSPGCPAPARSSWASQGGHRAGRSVLHHTPVLSFTPFCLLVRRDTPEGRDL